MHIETMSDKDILDFVKKRGGSPTAIGAIRSKTIECFFAQYSITVQCPKCGSLKKTRNDLYHDSLYFAESQNHSAL